MNAEVESKQYLPGIVECIGHWDNGDTEEDEEYLAESLYLTESGSYHLYCEGGLMTYYSRFDDGVEVKPLTKEEAHAWAVSRELAATIATWFA
jgi:hypothetical protein